MVEQPDLFSGRRIYRVTELLAEVSETLSSGWRRIAVVGEVAEVRRYPSGHIYFALKDESGKISAVMWRSDASRMKFQIEEGMAAVATGTLTIYPARGQFQIQVAALEPVGIGAMQLAFEQLKKKLAAEGLFDAARKRPLPFLPRRIGVVTSPQGAAIRDILNVLARRHPDLSITIYPVRVQGEEAPREIVEGIRAMNRHGGFDVLIVTRGGGSMGDLAAFNEETVARALAGSAIPTISAVGHEVDWTICDYVADLRAPTPSAAAELVVVAKEEIVRRVALAGRALFQSVRRAMAQMRQRVEAASGARAFVAFRYQLDQRRGRFEIARDTTAQAMKYRLERARRELTAAAGKLAALSPLSILGRGYAVVFREGETAPLTDAGRATAGDSLRIRLARGSLLATVAAVVREEKA